MTENYDGKRFFQSMIAFDQPPLQFQSLIVGEPDFMIIEMILFRFQMESISGRMGVKVEEGRRKNQ